MKHEVGDIVVLSPTSKYAGKFYNNPIDSLGEIFCCGLRKTYHVLWEKTKKSNSQYSHDCLINMKHYFKNYLQPTEKEIIMYEMVTGCKVFWVERENYE